MIENHAFGIRVKKSVNNLHKKYVREFSFFFNLDQSGSSAKSIENVNRENLVNWIRFSKNVLCIKSKRDTGDNFGYKKFQSHSSFEISKSHLKISVSSVSNSDCFNFDNFSMLGK